MEYYSAMRTQEILPLVTTWMKVEGIMLSEISQKKINTVSSHFYMESKRAKLIEQRVEWWFPGAEGWGTWGDVGQRIQTLI